MFDRDEQEISQIIENGLEAILTGSLTLEEVVAQHPEQAEVIRPELEGALWLVSQRQEVEARPGFVLSSRKRVVERIKAEARSQGAKHSLFGFAWPQRLSFQWAAAAMVVVALLLGAGGVITISQNTLPGDGLYAVKRISEQVSYSVTVGEVQRAQLSVQFTERRIHEVETLMARKEYPAAAKALNEYKQQVNNTLTLLGKISNSMAKQKMGTAVAFQNNLTQNAERINDLLANAPEMVRAELVQARDVTNVTAAATGALIDSIPTVGGTETPVPSGTPTDEDTLTPSFTDTDVPDEVDTEEPVVDLLPVVDPTDEEGTPTPRNPNALSTVTPDEPTETSTLTPSEVTQTSVASKTPRASRTPKPQTVPKSGTTSDNGKGTDNGKNNEKDPPGKNK